MIYCDQEPCNPGIMEERKIDNEEDCKNLKSLFLKIFEGSKTNRITLFDDDDFLTAEQLQIIIKIFNNNNILSDIAYEIINSPELYNMKFHKKGYFEDNEDDHSVIYTIAMGKKPSSGYSINIQKVKIKKNLTTIYAKEKNPGPNEAVMMF